MRNDLLSELSIWFKASKTDPALASFLRKGLHHWFTHPDYVCDNDNDNVTDSTPHNDAFQSQVDIGWYNLLSGFLSQDIVHLQQLHFNSIKSKKTGHTWGATLIKKLWNITHQLWIQRNDVLHNTDAINALSGIVPLKATITLEHALGPINLPGVYSSYFHIPLLSLLQKSPTYLKKWFLIIRSAREASSIVTNIDEFSTNSPLRAWVGLSAID